MGKPLIVYWSSNSGGTRRVAEALTTETVELQQYDGTSPYVLLCPTYDQPRGGFIPKPVQTFLDEHADHMVGVLPTGNLNFQEYYCQAGKDISSEHGVPIVHRIDIMGNGEDYRTIDRGMAEHWETLCRMRREAMSRN